MSFRTYVAARAGLVPARETPLGRLSLDDCTEDGELAPAPSSVVISEPYGLMVDRDAFLRSQTMVQRPLEMHPFDNPDPDPEREIVKVAQHEYVRLMKLSRNVGSVIGVDKPTAPDFHSWNQRQRTVDAGELDDLYLIRSACERFTGARDPLKINAWFSRAVGALRQLRTAAGLLEAAP